MKLRPALKKLFFSFLVLLLMLPAAELTLRARERLVWMLGATGTDGGMMIMGVRLNRRLWKMFLGNGFGDLRVLPGNASVAELLPPNGKWSAVNFLLPEEQREASRFSVTSDEHGFRGKSQKLTNKDFRVLVLGSYQAFGHGVNDEETYSYKLKLILNESKMLKAKKLRPVVWNGGMQSASLDRGIKVLNAKLDQLKPNLVILDYGMTDQVSTGPNPWLQPFAALATPGSWLFGKLDELSRANSTGPIGNFYLFSMLVNRSMQKHVEPNRKRFFDQLQGVLQTLEDRKIETLLLDQPVVGIPAQAYQQAIEMRSLASFLSVKKALTDFAKVSSAPSNASLRLDQASAPWLNEFPEEFRVYFEKKSGGLGPYLGDMLHINAEGHVLVAAEIAYWIENMAQLH